MNRKEIEKEFDKRFIVWVWLWVKSQIKSYFFNKILPEVLRELLPDTLWWHREDEKHIFAQWFDFSIFQMKENAKEKYNITL